MARKGKKNAARTAKQSQGNSLPKAHAKMLKAIDQEMEAGQLENALKYAEKLTADNPSLPAAWEKLSNIYAKSERARDAVEAYKKCIMCLGTSTEATELKLSQYEIMAGWGSQAIDRLSELCNKNPKNKKNWQHLSRAYHEIGKNQEALSANDKAYTLDPEDDGVLMLRCRVLDQMQQVSEAKNIALKLKKIAPGKINVSNYLGSLELREGNYIVAEKHFSDEMEVAESSIAAYNRFISWHYNPEVPIATFKEEALKWYERFKADKQVSRASTLSQINKKIKIGLLSGGFRTHPVGQMIYPALENINQAECDLIVFSTHQAEDGLTTKIKSAVGQWHSVSGMSDIELDRFIRDCDIDILIDMNGGGEGSRFRMLTHEPAPIIVKWVGILINTTGLKCIDYLLSDNVETPEGVDENYTEKLVRLPNDYICYYIPDYAPEVNELPAKANGYITFGCLNNPAKLSDPLIEEWSKVLIETPGSKLLLKNTQFEGEEFRQKTRDRFANFGIEEDRLILDGPEKHSEFLKAYHRIDIALDTWPYSGGLTTCEALMMGVPVITCTGPTFAGRHSATHLANAGLHELVTDNWEDFHRRVKELASDFESLATIRSALRTIVKDSPLCDGKLFADHFTTAMRAIWQRHCEGKAPEALTMDKEGHAQFEDEDTPVVLESVENTSGQSAGWSLDEPVIVVDNAALMPKHPRFSELLQSGNMAIMSFDPGSQYTKQAEELKALGEWHHHPHALLGDGSQQTLYVTLDPEKTGTLKPLRPEQLPERCRHDLQLLTELPIDSLRLDDIQGLPSVDILVLDDVNDAMAVLKHGSSYLKDALAIQVNISFQPTHENQYNLGSFQDWANKNGFQFYTLKNLEYYNYATGETCDNHSEVGELVSGEALFLPNRGRLEGLHENDKKKLAFYLDSACQMKGMAGAVLKMSIERNRLSYDRKNTVAKVTKSKKRFVHICFNNMHVQPLVDILGDGRSIEGYDNTVYIGRNRSIPGYDVDIASNSQALFFDVEAQLSKVISDCLDDDVVGVFFHGMFFPWQKRIAKEISSNKKLCWVIWGGDIYRQKKNDNEMLRIVGSIDCIATVTSSDYYIYQKVFGDKPHFQFSYKLPFDDADIERPLTKEKLIIVGNSGDPENRHADVIRELSKKKDILNYKIIIPFSYNASSDYLRKVKDYVEKCGLSDNAEFLTDFIDKEEYFSLISRAEVLVTAHERSQAGATINAAIFYGTNVVLKKYIAYEGAQIKNPMWTRIEDMKIEVVDYLGFKKINRLSVLSVKNKESVIMDRKGLISSRGEKKVKENLENLMDYMCGGVEK